MKNIIGPEFVPASVGCHWTRGPFFISSITMGDGSRSGYVVLRNRHIVAEFVTWAEVERITARADE